MTAKTILVGIVEDEISTIIGLLMMRFPWRAWRQGKKELRDELNGGKRDE